MHRSDVMLNFQYNGVNADLFPSVQLEVPTWTRASEREREQTQRDLLHSVHDLNSSPAAGDDSLTRTLALPSEERVCCVQYMHWHLCCFHWCPPTGVV